MKCPVCIQQNTKSRINNMGIVKTLMSCSPFYDEDGRYHHHDGNTITSGFHCTNGHSFSVARQGSCPCGWGKDIVPRVVVYSGLEDTRSKEEKARQGNGVTLTEPTLTLMFERSAFEYPFAR